MEKASDCPFFCEKKEAQRSGKGTALVPFQTPTKFRCRKRYGTTALVNPPAGNLCAVVHSARSRRAQNNLLHGHQFTRRCLRPPLSFPLLCVNGGFGHNFFCSLDTFQAYGNKESLLLFYSWRIHKGPSRSLMRIFAYFLFGRK